jgi:hypothetical protein
MKNKYLYFIIILVTIIIFSLYLSYKKEKFNTIVSKIDMSAGFYSILFFLLNHYIYAKKNNLNFKINSSIWTYKTDKGWEDYFVPISLKLNDGDEEKEYFHKNELDKYSIKDYIDSIKEVYVYNEKTQNAIELYKNKFNLEKYNYDYISIRRGDKIANGEAPYIEAEKYLNVLLNKNPNCKIIFLQSDDYASYKELINIINIKNLNIKVYTNSDENNNGATQDNIQNMNTNEIYNHTIDLLSCVDISKYSNKCVVDYSSNISRFIKWFHENPENVYSINDDINNDNKIDYNRLIICPSWGWS